MTKIIDAQMKIFSNPSRSITIISGGVGEINFGKQYRQGNRVYNGGKTAMACLASPVGNAGGHSYLYLIKSCLGDE